jgi:hypothetical protein
MSSNFESSNNQSPVFGKLFSSKCENVRCAIQNATHARENERETDKGSEQTKINDGLNGEESFPRRVSSLSSVHVKNLKPKSVRSRVCGSS